MRMKITESSGGVIRGSVSVYSIFKRYKRVRFYFPGDWHIGNPSHDAARFARFVNHIKADSSAFAIGMGDYGEFALKNSKGVERTQSLSPIQQSVEIKKQLKSAKRFIALVIGNHDLRLLLEGVGDVTKSIADELDLPCGRRLELAVEYSRGKFFEIACHHGDRAGSLIGMKNFMATTTAALGVLADSHERYMMPLDQYGVTGRERVAIRGSSFLTEDAHLVSMATKNPPRFGVAMLTLHKNGTWNAGFWEDRDDN